MARPTVLVVLPSVPHSELGRSNAAVLPTIVSACSFAPDVPVVVAWCGAPPIAPDGVELVERSGMQSVHEAAWDVTFRLGIDEVIWLAHDAVLTPTSVPTLLGDVGRCRSEVGGAIGVVAARSNTAPLPQDVRRSGGGQLLPHCRGYEQESPLLEVDRVALGLAAMSASTMALVEPPWFEELADEVFTLGLHAQGRRNFVSSAYVHRHPGPRLTTWAPDGSVDPEGGMRLRFIRPDLFDRWRAPDQGPPPTPADEEHNPDRALLRWWAQPDTTASRFGRARCLAALGRSADAAAALGDFEPSTLTIEQARTAADIARLVGDTGAAMELLLSRPELRGEADDLRSLIEKAKVWPFTFGSPSR